MSESHDAINLQIVKLWDEHQTDRQIAAVLGLTIEIVQARIRRIRERGIRLEIRRPTLVRPPIVRFPTREEIDRRRLDTEAIVSALARGRR
jgi:transposase